MKLCMMSSVFGFDAPREAVEAACYCKMEAIDWVLFAEQTVDPDFLRKLTLDAGLKVASYTPLFYSFINGEKDWQDKFFRELDKAVALSAPVMMVPPFPAENQISLEDDLQKWKEFYIRAAPLAKNAGVQLTTEATGMKKSPITTSSELMEILDAVPDLKLTLDYGNMATAGEKVENLKLFSGRIAQIHLKDWKIYSSPTENASLKRCGRYFADAVIGTGDIDVKASWDVLAPADKECFVNLETMDFYGTSSTREVLKKLSDEMRHW